MRKLFTYLFASIFFTTISFGQLYTLDAEIHEEYNNDLSQYEFTEKTEYEYNSTGQLTKAIDYVWDDNVNDWSPDNRYDYTYNASGDLGQKVTYFYSESFWLEDFISDYEYENEKLMSIRSYEEFVPGVESNIEKYEYTYDNSGRYESRTKYVWSDTENDWEGDTKITVDYTEPGIITWTTFNYENDSFLKDGKIDFYFNENNDLNTYEAYFFDNEDSEYSLLIQNIAAYDGIKLMSGTSGWFYDSTTQTFLVNYAEEYLYDYTITKDMLILPYESYNLPLTGNFETEVYFNHKIEEVETFVVRNDGNEPDEKTTYQYSETTITDLFDGKKQNVLHPYPNPADDQIFIENKDLYGAEAYIYSMKGNLEMSSKISERGYINLQNLNSGIYTLRLSSTDIPWVGKLTIK